MRPAGKGPLDSLYFDYPLFPAGSAPVLGYELGDIAAFRSAIRTALEDLG